MKENLTDLVELNEEHILQLLNLRYEQMLPYTLCSSILISVNPYKPLPQLYTDAQHGRYRRGGETAVAHPYIVANRAMDGVTRARVSQTIVITGESGAGKTEMGKICLNFANRCGDATSPRLKQIMNAGQVLEFLGNAQTVRNGNSSRFGKFLQVHYDQGAQVGASIKTYLLERSRVVNPLPMEGSFRIVYAVLDSLYEEYALNGFDRSVVGNSRAAVPSTWASFADACSQAGFGSDEVRLEISDIVAAVLFLLQRDYANASHLLGVDSGSLTLALHKRRTRVGDEVFWSECSLEDCKHRCKALAMSLYERMFGGGVDKLNGFIGGRVTELSLNILDIFGFESLDHNGLEQLCINYCNERIQSLFLTDVVVSQQRELEREGLECNVLGAGRKGDDAIASLCAVLFSTLDEAQRLPNSTAEDFIRACDGKKLKGFWRPRIQTGNVFVVEHYADDVHYTADEFLERNMDLLREEIVDVMRASTHPAVGAFFPSAVPSSSGKMWTASVVKIFAGEMANLMRTIGDTAVLYIRCIRPNERSAPGIFDMNFVERQVRANGIVQAANVMRRGYSHRMQQTAFLATFRRWGARLRRTLTADAGFYWGAHEMVYMTYECHVLVLKHEMASVIQRAGVRRNARRARTRLRWALRLALRTRRARLRACAREAEQRAEPEEPDLTGSSAAPRAAVIIQRRLRSHRGRNRHVFNRWKNLDELERLRAHIRILREEIRIKDEWIFCAKQKLR